MECNCSVGRKPCDLGYSPVGRDDWPTQSSRDADSAQRGMFILRPMGKSGEVRRLSIVSAATRVPSTHRGYWTGRILHLDEMARPEWTSRGKE